MWSQFAHNSGIMRRRLASAAAIGSLSACGVWWRWQKTPVACKGVACQDVPKDPRWILPPSIQNLRLHDSDLGIDAKARPHVAILGGSFDPITNGHIVSACEILHSGYADEVWIVPCGARPDKPGLKTPYLHRLMMCHLAVNTTFGSRFPIKVCDVEMLEPRALPCYDLMTKLEHEYPNKDFSFVIGSDLYQDLGTWDSGDRLKWLMNQCKWLVFDRPGYDMPNDLPDNFTAVQPPHGQRLAHQELASSEIRKRISKNFKPKAVPYTVEPRGLVDGLMPPAVMAHIIRYQLYAVEFDL